jgi:hypothetical protein
MLTIKQSTAANSNFRFATGRGIVGSISQAQATITSVEDINVSYIEPHVQSFIPPATTTTFDLQVMRSSNNQIVSISGQQGTANRIPFTAKLRSRSNEITGTAIDNSLILLQHINTAEEALSPLIDVNPGSVVIIENIIDNYTAFTQTANTFSNTLLQTTTTNVVLGMGVQGLGIADGTIVTGINGANVTLSIAANHTVDSGTVRFTSNDNKRYGISKNRYISKRLALSDGMDAEDLRVLITAYKPDSTDVEVYAKILNGVDGDTFNDKDWSKLVQVTNNGLYSDSLNPNDYREFEYTFDSSPAVVNITGTGRTDVSVNASNTTLEGFGTEFNTELTAGDTIKLIRTSDNELYDIRKITSITDYNTIVLNQAPSFTADGIVLQKVLEPYTAFKYKHNDGIVRYYNDAGAYFDGYKYMAIKIVLRAASSAVVPTVQDIRAIAISV